MNPWLHFIRATVVGGVLAGLLLTVLYWRWLDPLILHAEGIEAQMATGRAPIPGMVPGLLKQEWPPAAGWERLLFEMLENLFWSMLRGAGLCALMLVHLRRSGRLPGAGVGLGWGLAAFAALVAAPALELPPHLPGVINEAALSTRQAYGWIAAGNTAAGLALLALGRGWLQRGLGVALLAVPHVLGFEQVAIEPLLAFPPLLMARYASTLLIVQGMHWALLGALCGGVLGRGLGQEQPRRGG